MASSSTKAKIHSPTEIGENVTLEDGVVLGYSKSEERKKVIVGDGCIVRSNSIVYGGVELGKNVLVECNSVLEENTKIGDNTVIDGSKKAEIGQNVYIHNDVLMSGDEIHIGTGSKIGAHSKLVFKNLYLGKKVTINRNANIVAANIRIDDDTEIGENAKVFVAKDFMIGKHGEIRSFANFRSTEIKFADHLYAGNNFTVGGGGSNQPQSRLEVGNRCHIGNNVFINTSEPVFIGDDSSLGVDSVILTHGAWKQVLDGYLSKFAPVHIGKGVWIPHHIMILPGVTIGDGASIGAGAVVTKDIPANCFAAGVPARAIKDVEYPRKLSLQKKDQVVNEVLFQYIPIIKAKGYSAKAIRVKNTSIIELQKGRKKAKIVYSQIINRHVAALVSDFKDSRLIMLGFQNKLDDLTQKFNNLTFFDLESKIVSGTSDELSEDLRDFLRRKGIKIYDVKKFKSIMPTAFEELIKRMKSAERKYHRNLSAQS